MNQVDFLVKHQVIQAKKVLLDLAVPLAKGLLPKLATKATSSGIDKLERKISGKTFVRAGRIFNLFISNEDTDDNIKIVQSLEKSGLLIDGASETVKHEIKKKEGGFLGTMMAPMAISLIIPVVSSLIEPVASLLINTITGKGQKSGFLALPLIMKVLGKGVRRAERGYNNMNKNFQFHCILFVILRLQSISTTSLGLMMFFREEIYLE